MRRSSFDDAELFEHIGQSTGGRREFFAADSYSFRRLGKLEDLDLKLVASLRAMKWNRAHPERRREIAQRYWSRAEVKERAARQARERRAKKPKQVIVCGECRVTFDRRRGPVPKFCSERCRQRHAYQRRTPGARRIGPRLADLAQRKARRLLMKREWARTKAAKRRAA